jgi:hypothetical protein
MNGSFQGDDQPPAMIAVVPVTAWPLHWLLHALQANSAICTPKHARAAAAATSLNPFNPADNHSSERGHSMHSRSNTTHVRLYTYTHMFCRCSALVHHGGVGTTAAGLRCGKPTVVVPAFGDLFFFADMCHKVMRPAAAHNPARSWRKSVLNKQ